MIEKIGVVVPAHNEEDLLTACLESLMRATAALAVPWRIVVVLDRCTDRSRSVVHGFRAIQSIDLLAGNVGAARRAGASALLRWGSPSPPDRIWLATTDADSVVPTHWLRRQVQYAESGWEAFAGTVAVDDWTAHSADTRERWTADYRPVDGHQHVHGANLGCTADAYVAAGGWAPVAAHEDVALLDAMRGRRILRSPDPEVVTSARIDPRAPDGFGDTLTRLAG